MQALIAANAPDPLTAITPGQTLRLPQSACLIMVDNVGDGIVTDGSDTIKLVLADRVPATIYTVAGTGNTLGGGVTNLLPTASPDTTNGIAAPNGVRYDGAMLYFTSAGDGGVGRFFHSIKAQ